MKFIAILLLLVLSLPEANGAFPVSRRRVTRKAPPTPAPTATPAPALDRFLSAQFETILSPLSERATMPHAELTALRQYLSGQLGRVSLAEREQIQARITVCEALEQAINERERAILNPSASNWPGRSVFWRGKIEELKGKIATAPSAPLPLGR